MGQPVIFDIAYTPYKLKRTATTEEIRKHREERAFYDMSGKDNIYKYITTEGKIFGSESKKYTMLEYLQKSTGVFNQNGLLPKDEVKEMKRRAQTGNKNIWHGFISFDEWHSEMIDDPEKCIHLVKQTFGEFFKDAGFVKDNMDLMCSLHLDKPKHLHIHYVFWERAPKIKNKRAAGYLYRAKGKIPMSAIDKMTERLNAYTIPDDLAKKRDEVLKKFIKEDGYGEAVIHDMTSKKLKTLAEKLPARTRIWYANKEAAPYRNEIDGIVEFLITHNPKLKEADASFRNELENKKKALTEIMSNYYKERRKIEQSDMDGEVCFGNLNRIHTVEKLEWDYKRRLGNIVLSKAYEIKKNTFTYNKKIKHKINDKNLKRSIAISGRIVGKIIGGFIETLAELIIPEINSHSNRLQEIEEEIKANREKEQKEIDAKEQEYLEYIRKKYNYGK